MLRDQVAMKGINTMLREREAMQGLGTNTMLQELGAMKTGMMAVGKGKQNQG
jgi:hypothetical protein